MQSKSPYLYKEWQNNANLTVVKKILQTLEKNGLYENIHFYITYKTNFSNVKLPSYLKKEYPEEITLVLQNQFYNLKTNNLGFSVVLSFKGKPEELFIPWNAIIQIVDPETPFAIKLIPEDITNTLTNESSVKVIKFPKKTNE